SPPPAQKPVPQITGITPGDYEGYCDEPIGYQATGRITLAAGAAQQVTYWWILDGRPWQRQTVDFPAGSRPRTQDISATWTLDTPNGGSHTLGLMTEGGPSEPVERDFTFRCTPEPNPATLSFQYMLAPVHTGVCDGWMSQRAEALVMTDRETDIRYRFVVDGTPQPVRSERLRPGITQKVGDFWYSQARTSGSGNIRFEVLNHNKPTYTVPYSWTCKAATPGTVSITELRPMAYYGNCATDPYVTAHGTFKAPAGSEVTYRWVIDGKPTEAKTHKVESGGILQVQAWYWYRPERKDGTVALEVLNHDQPKAEAVYPVNCRT
ncbi:hypothetical protein HII36_53965, partial [Nonomuraea sp. NN258]|uniref:hypothetical protein n=1 Tax=Nonomuraea antri TaxID=2730852 RepID=UPI00156A5CE6